jgi:hypothetical protein
VKLSRRVDFEGFFMELKNREEKWRNGKNFKVKNIWQIFIPLKFSLANSFSDLQ